MTIRFLLLISIFSLAAISNQTHNRRQQMERKIYVVFFLKKLGLFQASRSYFYVIEYNCVFIFFNITLN